MRALAHPLRLELLELVAREGSLTSTRAAELTGESNASCSFHLRQLAKYGFLEDAGGGKGRERPWRVTQVDTRWSETPGDAAGAAAADALSAELLNRDLAELDRYRRTRLDYPPEWQDAGLINTSLLFLAPAELEELLEHQMAFVHARLDRTYDPAERPADARPVRFVSFAVPVDEP